MSSSCPRHPRGAHLKALREAPAEVLANDAAGKLRFKDYDGALADASRAIELDSVRQAGERDFGSPGGSVVAGVGASQQAPCLLQEDRERQGRGAAAAEQVAGLAEVGARAGQLPGLSLDEAELAELLGAPPEDVELLVEDGRLLGGCGAT